jgi:hypothetical protein
MSRAICADPTIPAGSFSASDNEPNRRFCNPPFGV